MDAKIRERLVARIISGTLRCKLLDGRIAILRPPGRDVRYAAEEVFNDAFERASFEGLFSEASLLEYLLEAGLWSTEKETRIAALEHDIEEFKVKLVELVYKSKQREGVRKYLAKYRSEWMSLLAEKSAYDYLTATAVANATRQRFVFLQTAVFEDGSWVGEADIDEVVDCYARQRLDDAQIRELARTEPWRGVYAAGSKDAMSIFGVAAADFTDEQRHLLTWSQMYANIAEHPEYPGDDIINDDDMLDGWLIIQRRRREAEEKERKAHSSMGSEKIRNSQEVFIVAETEDDIENVEALNNPVAAMIKRQRMKYVEQRGVVAEQCMPDTRRNIQMARNNMRSSSG